MNEEQKIEKGTVNFRGKHKIIVGIPSLDGVTHMSHTVMMLNTMTRYGEVGTVSQEGTYLDFARNQIVEKGYELASEAWGTPPNYFLFIDQDSVVPVDLFGLLLQHDLDIVSGFYVKKKAPYMPCFGFNAGTDFEWNPGTTFEVDWIGFGAVLIKERVFRELQEPYFKVVNNAEQQIGEDIYFCRQAKAAGFKIYVDSSIEIGHQGCTVWPKDFYVNLASLGKTGHAGLNYHMQAKGA